jgi:16S rRNA G966 N2-methylase RsmD
MVRKPRGQSYLGNKTNSDPNAQSLSYDSNVPALKFAVHHHKPWWYLCDRTRVNGKERHLILERYGAARPSLYAPEVKSGLAEALLPQMAPASCDLVYLDPPYGSTAGDWDMVPDWDWLGQEVSRLLRPTGQVVLRGAC